MEFDNPHYRAIKAFCDEFGHEASHVFGIEIDGSEGVIRFELRDKRDPNLPVAMEYRFKYNDRKAGNGEG